MNGVENPKRLRIAIAQLTEVGGFGGGDEIWADVAHEAALRGHTVLVSGNHSVNQTGRLQGLLDVGVELHTRSKLRATSQLYGFQKVRPAWASGADAALAKFGMAKRIRSFKPDVLLVNQAAFNLDGYRDVRRLLRDGLPYCLLTQMTWDAPRSDDARLASQRDFEESSMNAFVSAQTIEDLERQLAFSIPSAVIMRNPIHPSVRSVDAPLPWPSSRELRLAIPARLESHQKGHDLLFAALAKGRFERPLTLTVAGGGVDEAYLRRLAGFLRLENVRFAGNLPHLRELWLEHHALALPSRFEGLPLSLVEAAWCGRGSLVSDHVPNEGLVDDGFNGVICSPTVDSVATGLERLASVSDEELRAWGERSRERALGFAPNAAGASLVDKIEQVSSGKPGTREF